MLRLSTLAYICTVLAGLLSLSIVTSATHDMRYVIMDSTHDSPSITALLMALELSSKPDTNVKLLGAITTETPELEQLRQMLELSNLSACLPIISVEENELYPVYGDTVQIPDSVQFLIDQVVKYPGQVSIYSSGSLAAIAMAENVDPTFASNVAEVSQYIHIRRGVTDCLTASSFSTGNDSRKVSRSLPICHLKTLMMSALQHIRINHGLCKRQGCGFHGGCRCIAASCHIEI